MNVWQVMPGGWDGLNNFVTKSDHEVWGGKNGRDLLAIQNQRHSDSVWLHDLYQMTTLELDRHFTAAFWPPSVDHLI